jgi:hypothetical protein
MWAQSFPLKEVPVPQRQFPAFAAVLALAAGLACARADAQDLPNLPPITPEDLSLKDNPAAPGVPALILFYTVETDNTKSTETHAVRIKILSEEGKKHADIEIPYFDKASRVEEIRARTVAPDGKATEFADQIYDREIVKAKKFRVNAKVLTLPNVQVGSIIEYSYRLRFKGSVPDVFRHPAGYLVTTGFTYPAAEWTIQQDLFVRHAHFVLHPVKEAQIHEHHVAMPENVGPRRMGDGSIQLDMDNIPGYEEEEYSPPEDNLKTRVDLYYGVGFYGPESYWMGLGKRRAEQYDSFLGKSKGIEREAARLVVANDSGEEKLRKIYARVQQIRAVSYESEKTEKERKQENLKENKNAEDILNRGYAFGNEINLLFVALARAAGFEAYPILVTSRNRSFFMKDYPDESQLNAMVVEVRFDSNTIYLDPATRFCPYGLLPWEEADTGGVRVDRIWSKVASTPPSKSTDAVTRRKAKLRLNSEAGLQGRIEVVYFGQEALSKRREALREDEPARRKQLEESMKSGLAHVATVKLVHSEGWESPEGPLKAEFEIEVPSFAAEAGRRLVLPVGVFHINQQNPFPSARRVHPIYFGYPQETYEEVEVELPAGMQAESLPAARIADQGAAYYEFSAKKEGNTLRMTRVLRLSSCLVKQQQYSILRGFYGTVLAGDSQQAIVVRQVENANAK